MDFDLYVKTYLPELLKIAQRHDSDTAASVMRIVSTGTHVQLNQLSDTIKELAMTRMIIDTFPGCPYCFNVGCTSDHK